MIDRQEQKLLEATKNDPIYRQLLSQCRAPENDYIRISHQLSDADRDVLQRYISLCEELEYRRTCLAMDMVTL